mmetsp:Transcript_11557/g.35156  ORF Transcript_11557/g.35156 Transcript_11557/m.35156 type:complete len:94 (+) Transcript_11557:20-301(+)
MAMVMVMESAAKKKTPGAAARNPMLLRELKSVLGARGVTDEGNLPHPTVTSNGRVDVPARTEEPEEMSPPWTRDSNPMLLGELKSVLGARKKS